MGHRFTQIFIRAIADLGKAQGDSNAEVGTRNAEFFCADGLLAKPAKQKIGSGQPFQLGTRHRKTTRGDGETETRRKRIDCGCGISDCEVVILFPQSTYYYLYFSPEYLSLFC
jgi:hypothetical protein